MYAPETKILVIDDMKTMRMVMKKCLKELGFTNLAEADDGETAWPLIDQEASAGTPFQLILSDWNMPKLSGLDLLKKIRKDERVKAVPFLLITAESDKGQVMEAIKAGVSNYLVKPFTADQVKEKLEAVHKKLGG
jgi:two-component system, chemotaxis family, chemotaxis protein CheY